MRWDRCHTLLSTVTFLFVGAPSFAAKPVVTTLAYEADASCPSASAFLALVRRKAPAVEVRTTTKQEAEVVVTLQSGGDSFDGTLEMRRSDGTHYVRQIRGVSCDEVAPALAFVMALSLVGEDVPPTQDTR